MQNGDDYDGAHECADKKYGGQLEEQEDVIVEGPPSGGVDGSGDDDQ